MTVEEARLLKKGDYVFYKDIKYKVLHIKECRASHTNEIYINIKCQRQNETAWLTNNFVRG